MLRRKRSAVLDGRAAILRSAFAVFVLWLGGECRVFAAHRAKRRDGPVASKGWRECADAVAVCEGDKAIGRGPQVSIEKSQFDGFAAVAAAGGVAADIFVRVTASRYSNSSTSGSSLVAIFNSGVISRAMITTRTFSAANLSFTDSL